VKDGAGIQPGSPEFYRKRARKLLKQAENAPNDAARAQLLLLADHWHRLAQAIEKPNW
jgi:hypothetical protein